MKNLPLLLLLLFLTACDKATYKETFDFTDNQWKRTDTKTFNFKIDEAGRYDVLILYRHIHGIPFREIPLSVTFSENGKPAETQPFNLTIADGQGNMLSDCLGDICDIEATVMENHEFASGDYSISLANTFDHDYLPNTPAVGIKVVKVQ